VTAEIQSIELARLIPHPDNPNQMSSATFARLVRNIKRTGCYEPIVARLHPEQPGFFQIINGHHRCRALAKLNYQQADVLVWDVDDEQTDILLATLNRLAGRDELSAKLKLLRRLNERFETRELSRLVPHTAAQIQKLTNLRRPDSPIPSKEPLARSMVFFLDAAQHAVVERALRQVPPTDQQTKAAQRAAALTFLAEQYLSRPQ